MDNHTFNQENEMMLDNSGLNLSNKILDIFDICGTRLEVFQDYYKKNLKYLLS